MIPIAQRDSIQLQSATDLRRAAERMAIDHFPVLIQEPRSELEKIAANRERHMSSLDLVPGELHAWAQSHTGEEVMIIAAFLERNPDLELDDPSPWLGIPDETRWVLGDRAAQALLFEAEGLRGRAQRDQELAARMAGLDRRGSRVLGRAATKLDLAAEAVAAQNVLETMKMIDSAPEKAREAGVEYATRDLVGPPTKRYAEVMGSDTHGALTECSSRTAKLLTRIDDRSLGYLAKDTANPWSKENFDPNVAALQGRLERDRDVALREGLDAAQRFGRDGHDFDEMIRDQMWSELGAIDEQMSALPEAGNSRGLLGADSVSAVLHDASQRALAERSAERTGPSQEHWEPGPEPDIGDIGI